MDLYAAGTFVFTGVLALVAVIALLPQLGIDTRIFGRDRAMVSAAITSTKSRLPVWAVFIIACVALVGSFFGLYRTFENNGLLTADTAQEQITSWLQDFHMDNRLLSAIEKPYNFLFVVRVTAFNGDPMYAGIVQEHKNWMVIYTDLTLPPQYLEVLGKLSPQDTSNLNSQLDVRLAMTTVTFTMTTPLKSFHFERFFPLENLNEDAFMTHVDEVHNAMIIAKETVNQEIMRAKPQALAR